MANPPPPLETRIDSMRLREHTPKVSIWEPPAPTTTRSAPIAIPIERELIAAIEAPLEHGETHRVGGDRKEREIAALFERLTPAQSLALSTRLAAARADDPIVSAFSRLVVERKTRLVAYLARRRLRTR